MAEVVSKIRGTIGVCGLTNKNCIFNNLQKEGVQYSKSEMIEVCPHVKVGRIIDGVLSFKCSNMFTPICGFSVKCNNCGAEISTGKKALSNEIVCSNCGNSARPIAHNAGDLTTFLCDGDLVELANNKIYRFFRNGLVEEVKDGTRDILSASDYIWNTQEKTFMSPDIPELGVKKVLRPKCYEGLSSTSAEHFSLIFEK